MTPNDPFDYDGVNELIQAELTIDGTPRQVIMQANRNGFLYLLERATGKLLAARMDTAIPQGAFLLSVFCALAQYERALTQERIKAGLAAAKRRGKRGDGPGECSPLER